MEWKERSAEFERTETKVRWDVEEICVKVNEISEKFESLSQFYFFRCPNRTTLTIVECIWLGSSKSFCIS